MPYFHYKEGQSYLILNFLHGNWRFLHIDVSYVIIIFMARAAENLSRVEWYLGKASFILSKRNSNYSFYGENQIKETLFIILWMRKYFQYFIRNCLQSISNLSLVWHKDRNIEHHATIELNINALLVLFSNYYSTRGALKLIMRIYL